MVAFWKNFCNRGLFLPVVLCCIACGASGQRATVAFWNVENLFDTIPSKFYDDREFSPRGENRWGSERYETKIANLARVIDDMEADVVGLAEVENEDVVRDLVRALKTDYNYIHRTSGDGRGIDQALLYKGDRFFPDPKGTRLVSSGMSREFLHVEGELLGEHLHLVVCHMSSNYNSYEHRRRNMQSLRRLLERLLTKDPAANIVTMGDMNATPDDRVVRKAIGGIASPYDFVYTPHWADHKAGRGSYNYRGRWYLYDWMMLSPSIARGAALKVERAGVYAKEYLTEPATATAGGSRRPLRSFYGNDYLGGYSDHFPVWVIIGK